ncbi:unknown [Alistipes sp. CAG:157]|nr:unknown [Alistipes sp. CAG:157]
MAPYFLLYLKRENNRRYGFNPLYYSAPNLHIKNPYRFLLIWAPIRSIRTLRIAQILQGSPYQSIGIDHVFFHFTAYAGGRYRPQIRPPDRPCGCCASHVGRQGTRSASVCGHRWEDGHLRLSPERGHVRKSGIRRTLHGDSKRKRPASGHALGTCSPFRHPHRERAV